MVTSQDQQKSRLWPATKMVQLINQRSWRPLRDYLRLLSDRRFAVNVVETQGQLSILRIRFLAHLNYQLRFPRCIWYTINRTLFSEQVVSGFDVLKRLTYIAYNSPSMSIASTTLGNLPHEASITGVGEKMRSDPSRSNVELSLASVQFRKLLRLSHPILSSFPH